MTKNTSDLFSSLLHSYHHNSFNKLCLAFLLSLALISCSGGGSSNSSDGSNSGRSTSASDVECSDGFGDASRCEARENL